MDEVQLARIDWELQLLFSPAPDSVVFPKLGISYDTNTEDRAEDRERKARQQREYRARKRSEAQRAGLV
jgi:hypothetical protein